MKKIMSFVLAGTISVMSTVCLSACGSSNTESANMEPVMESATADTDEVHEITASVVPKTSGETDVKVSSEEITSADFEDTEEAALDYALDTLTAKPYSYSSLIDKLERKGYSEENATYAADYCGANWYEEAYKKSLEYLVDSPFSHDGLVEQLEFEGFLNEEAVYAADNCGADWYEQAATEAQNYVDYYRNSGDEIVSEYVKNDLKLSLFTDDQINYAMAEVGLN